jgi:hypothetical protein
MFDPPRPPPLVTCDVLHLTCGAGWRLRSGSAFFCRRGESSWRLVTRDVLNLPLPPGDIISPGKHSRHDVRAHATRDAHVCGRLHGLSS